MKEIGVVARKMMVVIVGDRHVVGLIGCWRVCIKRCGSC